MAGRNSIPVELVNARREFIARLKISGSSVDAICEIVNSVSAEYGWGKVHRRTVFYDIYFYFREHPALMDDGYNYAHIQHRDILDRLEKDIEEISLEIERRNAANDWRPFEFPKYIMRRHKMLMKEADIMGWNYSKRKKPRWQK